MRSSSLTAILDAISYPSAMRRGWIPRSRRTSACSRRSRRGRPRRWCRADLVSWDRESSTRSLPIWCSTSICSRIVAPSLVMVMSPSPLWRILSIPWWPRVVRGARGSGAGFGGARSRSTLFFFSRRLSVWRACLTRQGRGRTLGPREERRVRATDLAAWMLAFGPRCHGSGSWRLAPVDAREGRGAEVSHDRRRRFGGHTQIAGAKRRRAARSRDAGVEFPRVRRRDAHLDDDEGAPEFIERETHLGERYEA